MATATRVLGELGTVEEAYRPKASPKYSRSSAPKGSYVSSITATVPSETRQAKMAAIDAQHARRAKPKRAHGGQALWVEFLGYSQRRDYYGIRVKVRGMAATDQWLPYHLAASTWFDISGTDIVDYLY